MTAFDAHSLEILVTEKTRAAGSSFYWAMRMLEPKRRLAMYAIYAFCRDADDIVDEPGEEDDKRARLDRWEADIGALYRRATPRQPLAAALAPAIAQFGLPMADFIAVIDGCRMDLGKGVVRPSLAELDLYCDRVAAAVGRLSVRVFGETSPQGLDLADHQGRALQLTNILRDVVVDAGIGRVYLPDELLARHGVMGADIPSILAHPALSAVCADLAKEAERHFIEARKALALCAPQAVRPAVVMMEMYWAIFRACRHLGWQPQAEPASLPKYVKLWCALRHGILGGFLTKG